MRILVLETAVDGAGGIVADLEAAGHEVVRCFGPGGAPFPCNALGSGSGCPVDEGIDVAVVLRTRPWPKPTPFERGAVCALRARVPLVVCGNCALNPWAPWASAAVDGTAGIVSACERFEDREEL